jgi:hypothetical protein
MLAGGDNGMPSARTSAIGLDETSNKQRTFGHAVQTSQVTAFCDADAQVVVLALEGVGQEVGEGLRRLEGSSARGDMLGRRCRHRGGLNTLMRLAVSTQRGVCGETAVLEDGSQSQRGRARPDPSHGEHVSDVRAGIPQPASGADMSLYR